MRSLQLVIILISFQSFTQTNTQTDFKHFIEQIPSIQIGFEANCNKPIKTILLDHKLIPEGASVVGKLQAIENNYFIIFTYPADIQFPILQVYNSFGEKINEFNLFSYADCNIENTKISSAFKLVSPTKIEIYRVTHGEQVMTELVETIDIYNLTTGN